MRNSAITAVQEQYEWVLGSLEEMAKGISRKASTASGLLEHLSKVKTVLGLTLASAFDGKLKCLNSAEEDRDCLWYTGCNRLCPILSSLKEK